MVDAWERVVKRLPEARLVMCGTGPLERALRSRAASSPARHTIDVLGSVPDLEPHYAAAGVFVLATRVEGGITMATLEAMSRGLVPVVSDAGDAFLLEHARCGIVTQPRSSQAIADAVIQLFEHPGEHADMRGRAIRFAHDDWTADDMLGETLDFYVQLRDGR